MNDLRMSITECAKLTGMAEQTIRVGLQQEKLPFGAFIKQPGNNRGSYFISRHKVYEYLGIKKADTPMSTTDKN